MSTLLGVTRWGKAGAVPVVLLHGFLGSSADWKGIAPLLADRRPVIALDLPGHGASTGLPQDAYTLHGAARAVIMTMDELDLERVSIVGYSMGGRVAGHVALAAPSRLDHLVLESAHPGLRSPEERDARLSLDRERARRLEVDPGGFLDEWYRSPIFGLAKRATARREMVADRLRGDPADLARALLGMSTGLQEPMGERLRALGVPTLLVAGGRDRAYVRLLGNASEQHGFDLHVEPGSTHNVHLDRPSAFASIVTSFLEPKNPTEHGHD